MSRTSKVSDAQKKFGTEAVRQIGATVAALQKFGAECELPPQEIKKILLLTFKLIGEKAGLSYASLIQTIRHHND